MTEQNRNILTVVAIIVVVAVLGYFAWKERGASMPPPVATSTAISINASSSTVATSSGQGYIIKPITATPAPVAPNYKTPLSFPASMSAADRAVYEGQFADIQSTLASSPNDWSSWIDLGMLRKETGDYQGAATDWKYLTKLYLSDPTAYADLGDLYASYLNQPSQGIAYYKQAIALDPIKEVSFYENLAQIYIAQGDKSDARTTLQQGITAKVVGYQNLQNMLNSM